MKKKKSVKKTTKKVEKEDPNKEVEYQFFWLVGIVILIILAFIFVPILYHQIFEKFEYAGVKFEKMKQGDITFYHGQFPIIYRGNFSAVYNVYLRHDPRENNIPINTDLGLARQVSVSLGDDVHLCEDMMLGQSEIGKFVSAFPFVKNITSGVYNKSTAELYNVSQISCANASTDNAVYIIRMSDAPSIDLGEKDNCYILNIGQCEYLETIERFVVGAMAQVNEKPLE